MPPDTRQSMVLAAVELLRERGVDGVTLDAVLSRSGAPTAAKMCALSSRILVQPLREFP